MHWHNGPKWIYFYFSLMRRFVKKLVRMALTLHVYWIIMGEEGEREAEWTLRVLNDIRNMKRMLLAQTFMLRISTLLIVIYFISFHFWVCSGHVCTRFNSWFNCTLLYTFIFYSFIQHFSAVVSSIDSLLAFPYSISNTSSFGFDSFFCSLLFNNQIAICQ